MASIVLAAFYVSHLHLKFQHPSFISKGRACAPKIPAFAQKKRQTAENAALLNEDRSLQRRFLATHDYGHKSNAAVVRGFLFARDG